MIPALEELQDVIAEPDWQKRLARFRAWTKEWVATITAQQIIPRLELRLVRDLDSIRDHIDHSLARSIGAMLDQDLGKAAEHVVEPHVDRGPFAAPVRAGEEDELRRITVRLLRHAPRKA